MVNAKFLWTGENGREYCTNNEGEGLFVFSRGNWEQVSGTFQFRLETGKRAEIVKMCNHVFGTGTQIPPVPNEAAAALGSISTDAKAAAARENGKRGGRPRKQ